MLFTVSYGTGPTEFDIAVVDLATGLHRLLVRGVTAKYATSGHLVYVTANGTLMAAPFDEDAMALAGEATTLVQGVGVGVFGVVDLTVSETGTLMYTTGSSNPLWRQAGGPPGCNNGYRVGDGTRTRKSGGGSYSVSGKR